MIPANLINSLQTLYRSAKPLIVAADAPANPVGKLEPGQRVQGAIQSQVSPGLFKVQVEGQILQLRLPGQLQAGSTLDLKVEATSPRLTFSFYASSNPISTREQISATSRFIANIAELPLTRTLIESSSRSAVWQTSGTPPDTRQLAVALRDTLANSGLFYESHQAQWVRGERSTTQLLVEPQNQLVEKKSAATTPPSDSPSPIASQVDQPVSDKTSTSLPIAKELVTLVQQQLHTLETHQLTWSGQIWPDQHMQWEIQGQPEQHAQHPDERQWSTEMELAMAHLGDVHARLVYSQGALKLALQSSDAAAIELFNRRMPALRHTLSEAGINLISAVIEKS